MASPLASFVVFVSGTVVPSGLVTPPPVGGVSVFLTPSVSGFWPAGGTEGGGVLVTVVILSLLAFLESETDLERSAAALSS
jgi:hypothetical protein